MPPQPIVLPKQLMVEGADAHRFFSALLRAQGYQDIQVQNFGGNSQLHDALDTLTKLNGFDGVTSLAVIRDAERDPAAAFRSICSALGQARLACPAGAGKFVSGKPRIGVFILPDKDSPGMLESLCLRAVAADLTIVCVDELMACLAKVKMISTNPTKARLQAYLAAQPRPGLRLGEAADAGIWPWDHLAFEPLKAFLRAL